MNSLIPAEWAIPVFVGIGLVISQLFIYGKKVKRRVKITFAELLGDGMQFGVRMVITIASIKGIEKVTAKPFNDMWQVVAVTIVICTSFDTYFIKIRELALTRVVGAAGVLFGRIPQESMIELGMDEDEKPAVKVTTIKNADKLTDAGVKVGIPTRSLFVPDSKDDGQALIDLMGKLDKPR